MSKKKSILYVHLNLSISLLVAQIIFVTTVQWARPIYVSNRMIDFFDKRVNLFKSNTFLVMVDWIMLEPWHHFWIKILSCILGFVCDYYCSSPLLSPLFLLDAGRRNHDLSYGGEGVWDSSGELVLVHLSRMGWVSPDWGSVLMKAVIFVQVYLFP